MKHIIRLLLISLVLPIPLDALAAKKPQSPLVELLEDPDRIRIIVAEVVRKSEPGTLHVVVSEQLSGDSPDEMVIGTDSVSFEELEPGKSYIFAWSDKRKAALVHKGWEENPEGPRTAKVSALGITTIFETTPELVSLFTQKSADGPLDLNGEIDALLSQLKYNDERAQGLASAELYMRDDLLAVMSDQQVSRLEKVIQTAPLTTQYRDLVMRSALRLPPESTESWLGEELRRIIIMKGTQYDLHSFDPTLVRTAARGLKQAGNPRDVDLLSILLYSNNPGVSKAAMRTMNALDEEAASRLGAMALERGWILDETRREIERITN